MKKDLLVFSSDAESIGRVATGVAIFCRMEGCTGRKYAVRWDDGRLTYVCTKGLTELDSGNYQIS